MGKLKSLMLVLLLICLLPFTIYSEEENVDVDNTLSNEVITKEEEAPLENIEEKLTEEVIEEIPNNEEEPLDTLEDILDVGILETDLATVEINNGERRVDKPTTTFEKVYLVCISVVVLTVISIFLAFVVKLLKTYYRILSKKNTKTSRVNTVSKGAK